MSHGRKFNADEAEEALMEQFRRQLEAEISRRGRGGQQSVADDLGVHARTVRDYLNGGNVGLGKLVVSAKKLGIVLEYKGVVLARLGNR